MNYAQRIREITEILTPAYRSKSGNRYSVPFVSIMLTGSGFWPSIDHGRLGDRLSDYPTLEEALDACEAEARRIANAENALARTLGIEAA